MRARHLTVAAALLLLIGAGQTLGGEPTAAGLWQSLTMRKAINRTPGFSFATTGEASTREPSCACS